MDVLVVWAKWVGYKWLISEAVNTQSSGAV